MKLIYAEKFASGIALMEMSFLESGDGKETEYKRGAIATMEAIRPKHIVKTCRMDKSL